MSALEACLNGVSGLEIVSLGCDLPDLAARLSEARPDAVLIEQCESLPSLALPILRAHPGIPVVAVDVERNTATVLSSETYAALSTADLAGLLRSAPMSSTSRKRRTFGQPHSAEEEKP